MCVRVRHCVQLSYTIGAYTSQNSSDYFPPNLQTIVKSKMLSIAAWE